MGILDDYFDGYYSEEMIESQVFFFRFRSHLFYLAEFSLIIFSLCHSSLELDLGT